MKSIFLTFALFLSSILMYAGPIFKWGTTSHVFETIKQGKQLIWQFEFTNIGDEPIVIMSAKASCSCTKATFPNKPILPGEKGIIKVTYDSKDKPYPFQKTITVISNVKRDGKMMPVELFIKGNVTE